MSAPIRFYFDFASPYAYFALDGIEALAAEHGRTVEWRPMLTWAALKAHGISAPMDAPAKRAYFETDMIRSAAFHGLEYRHPTKMPISSHRCARLYYAVEQSDPEMARAFGRDVFSAFFVRGEDITDETTVLRLAESCGIDAPAALEAMNGEVGRERLAGVIEDAIADQVCGSPYFIVDGESFFGADRLPQIAWRLSQTRS